MKLKLLIALGVVLGAGLATSCRANRAAEKPDPLARAYDSEPDWNDSQHVIPLNYQQAQGKRVFYQYCVWCHADSTPAGPSNRSNLNPNPPLANDGATLNVLSDDFMRNVITMGGAAAGKSASMPPWERRSVKMTSRRSSPFTAPSLNLPTKLQRGRGPNIR